MALTLSVRSKEPNAPAPTITLGDSPRVVIGRSAGCDVQLPDPSVSQRHASIRRSGGDFLLLDENSRNGTFIGHVRLPPGTPRVLRPRDMVRFGRVWVQVDFDHGAPPSANHETKELALLLVAGALRGEGEAYAPIVRVSRGPDPTAGPLILEAFGHPYTIGRSPQCDLVIADDDLSRRHVELERIGGDVMVKDLGSKNGSALGEQVIEGSRKWSGREPLLIGRTALSLEDPVSQVLREIEACPDEVVEESLEPPPAIEKGAGAPAAGAHEADAPQRVSDHGSRAPIAERPQRASGAAPARAGWSTVDLLIAALALLVLASSVAGIAWLLRG